MADGLKLPIAKGSDYIAAEYISDHANLRDNAVPHHPMAIPVASQVHEHEPHSESGWGSPYNPGDEAK